MAIIGTKQGKLSKVMYVFLFQVLASQNVIIQK